MTLFFFFIRHTNQTLADEVGIDVTRHVVNNLVGAQPKYLGVRMEGADLAMLDAFVEKGLIGKKATKGFFDYSDPKAKSRSVTKEASEIIAKFSDPKKSAKGLKPEALESFFTLTPISPICRTPLLPTSQNLIPCRTRTGTT